MRFFTVSDVFDISTFAQDPKMTAAVSQTFQHLLAVADIVTVNGKPARGLWISQIQSMPVRVNPQPGQGIGDINAGSIGFCIWHILQADGTYLGTISDRGAAAPGPSPDHTVVGGSGVFLGVTGIHRSSVASVPLRNASVAEDPSRRRIHGGGKLSAVFYLYPKDRPTVEVLPEGPSVFHGADFSPVTPAKPARAGETLIVRAKGLGPTLPELLPPGARPFPMDSAEQVLAPVEASIGGKESQVINKIGWPGTLDLYRLDIRVPDGIPRGMASVQFTAAWAPGPEVKIPVE